MTPDQRARLEWLTEFLDSEESRSAVKAALAHIDALEAEGKDKRRRSPAASAAARTARRSTPVSSPLSIRVYGTAAPKGSMRAFVRGKHAHVTEANARTRPWAALVSDATRQALGDESVPFPHGQAVAIRLAFVLPRPVSLPKRTPRAHTSRPDVDKLTRTVLDALTGLVWDDDGQVVWVSADKRYARVAEPPHCDITVQQVLPEQVEVS